MTGEAITNKLIYNNRYYSQFILLEFFKNVSHQNTSYTILTLKVSYKLEYNESMVNHILY